MLSELKSIHLFSNLGRPCVLPHGSISSWREALESCHSEPWEALRLMTHNRDANRVNELNWDRCQERNPICERLRPEILRITEDAVARIGTTREVTNHFLHSVS